MKTVPTGWQEGRLVLAVALALALVGCARSMPVQYYQLSATAAAPPAANLSLPANAVIALAPVRLPAYLDRSQIVSRSSANRLHLSDQKRWAEPLADNVQRVLLEDLAGLLGSAHVLSQAWLDGQKPVATLAVEVLQFEIGANGSAVLLAQWQAMGQDGLPLLSARTSTFQVAPTASSQEGRVAALSQTVSLLAHEIAAALPPLLAH